MNSSNFDSNTDERVDHQHNNQNHQNSQNNPNYGTIPTPEVIYELTSKLAGADRRCCFRKRRGMAGKNLSSDSFSMLKPSQVRWFSIDWEGPSKEWRIIYDKEPILDINNHQFADADKSIYIKDISSIALEPYPLIGFRIYRDREVIQLSPTNESKAKDISEYWANAIEAALELIKYPEEITEKLREKWFASVTESIENDMEQGQEQDQNESEDGSSSNNNNHHLKDNHEEENKNEGRDVGKSAEILTENNTRQSIPNEADGTVARRSSVMLDYSAYDQDEVPVKMFEKKEFIKERIPSRRPSEIQREKSKLQAISNAFGKVFFVKKNNRNPLEIGGINRSVNMSARQHIPVDEMHSHSLDNAVDNTESSLDQSQEHNETQDLVNMKENISRTPFSSSSSPSPSSSPEQTIENKPIKGILRNQKKDQETLTDPSTLSDSPTNESSKENITMLEKLKQETVNYDYSFEPNLSHSSHLSHSFHKQKSIPVVDQLIQNAKRAEENRKTDMKLYANYYESEKRTRRNIRENRSRIPQPTSIMVAKPAHDRKIRGNSPTLSTHSVLSTSSVTHDNSNEYKLSIDALLVQPTKVSSNSSSDSNSSSNIEVVCSIDPIQSVLSISQKINSKLRSTSKPNKDEYSPVTTSIPIHNILAAQYAMEPNKQHNSLSGEYLHIKLYIAHITNKNNVNLSDISSSRRSSGGWLTLKVLNNEDNVNSWIKLLVHSKNQNTRYS